MDPIMSRRRRQLLIVLCALLTVLATWRNLQTISTLHLSAQHDTNAIAILPLYHPNNSTDASLFMNNKRENDLYLYPSNNRSKTKILGFADYNYKDYALRWYHRLQDLGYREHVIVVVDQAAVDFFRSTTNNIRWEELPYKPCVTWEQDARFYRRQLFGRRWKYVYEQLQKGFSVLLTDVDNVFLRYHPLQDFEESEYDAFYAYSTSYPTHVFDQMGFTVCGGMSWLRADPKVIRFVATLVNKCKCLNEDDGNFCKKCHCDDQVALNELLWEGKHNVTWDRTFRTPPKSLKDYPWTSVTGISSKTRHRVKVWDRNFAYRAMLPDQCPEGNWVAMPLYVNRSDVVQVWEDLCSSNKNQTTATS
jgi:hypothetical protein